MLQRIFVPSSERYRRSSGGVRRASSAIGLAFLGVVGIACGGVEGVLASAQHAYEQARYEDARVWLAEVADEIAADEIDVRVRYHYLQGMTAYRLDAPLLARHHLALAAELAGGHAAELLGQPRARVLVRTLAALEGPEISAGEARTASSP